MAEYHSDDCESLLIRPGLPNPPLVCVTYCSTDAPRAVGWGSLEAHDSVDTFLPDEGISVAHNAKYDALAYWTWTRGGKARVLKQYAEGRRHCTLITQQLIQICTHIPPGALALDKLRARWGLTVAQAKDDAPRKLFGPLLGYPFAEFPREHRQYALGDPRDTLELYLRQRERTRKVLADETIAFFSYVDFAFGWMSNQGIRTDPHEIASLQTNADREIARLKVLCQDPLPFGEEEEQTVEQLVQILKGLDVTSKAGKKALRALDEFRLIRTYGTKAGCANNKRLQKAVYHAYDGKPPMTEAARGRTSPKPFKPQVARGHEALTDSGDPFLADYANYGIWAKVKSTDLKMLRDGTRMPIHTKFGLARTGRRTSSDPNLQNLRVASGIRECFAARDGYVFIDSDFKSLEFVCTADICTEHLGLRDLTDQVNLGVDFLSMTAKELHHCSYEEAVRRFKTKAPNGVAYRQASKIVTYGRLGGLGNPKRLQKYARKYGINEPEQFWKDVLRALKRGQPTIEAYLAYAGRLPLTPQGLFIAPIYGAPGGLRRWGVPFTAAANTGFQGLGSIVAGYTALEFQRRSQDRTNVLSECRVLLNVHDSFVAEVPKSLMREGFAEVESVMSDAPKLVLKHTILQSETSAVANLGKNAPNLMNL